MPDSILVLKTESVQRLRRAILAKPELFELNIEELTEQLNLGFVSAPYATNKDPKLEIPKGFSQNENLDSENCQKILQIFPALTPAQATDERLWVTLCFGDFAEYTRARWPFRNSEEDKLSKHIFNHWFASNIRGRMRDNAIGRLWWMGYTARKVPGMSMSEVYEILFANSDYRSSLLERNSSANSLNVLVAVLKVSADAYKAGIPYKREPFRKFMSRVDTLGGRSNLAAMNEETLKDLLIPIYKDCYSAE